MRILSLDHAAIKTSRLEEARAFFVVRVELNALGRP
jgi:hypothetical protein